MFIGFSTAAPVYWGRLYFELQGALAMKPVPSFSSFARILALGALLALGAHAQAQGDPLPSWNDGAARQAIVQFVKATTTQGSPQFVPPAERIATFD
jgi:hypothetical protein